MIARHEWNRHSVPIREIPGGFFTPDLRHFVCLRCGQDMAGAWSGAMLDLAMRKREKGHPAYLALPTSRAAMQALWQEANEAMDAAPMCSLVVGWPEGKLV